MATNEDQYVEYFFASARVDVEMKNGVLGWNGTTERETIPEPLRTKLAEGYFEYTGSQQDVRVELVRGKERVRLETATDGPYQVLVHMEYLAGVTPNREGTHEMLLKGMKESAGAQIEDVLEAMQIPKRRARISVEEVGHRA